MSQGAFSRSQFRAYSRYGFIVAAIGIVLLIIGFFINTPQAFRSYHFSWLFWTQLSLGAMLMLMVQYLISGAWGFLIRRILEPAALLIPLMGLLFLPSLFGLHHLYEWTNAETAQHSIEVARKRAFLNTPFFIARYPVYFMVWSFLTWRLVAWSTARDRSPETLARPRLRFWSTLGVIIHFILFTFASVDWVMSLEASWFSTMLPVLMIVGQSLLALSFAILIFLLLSSVAQPRPAVQLLPNIRPWQINDMGNMLLAAVLLWTYMSFVQFLIIWYGNLPDDNSWYIHRAHGGWLAIAIFLAVFHFAIPFAVLLSRGAKRDYRVMSGTAALLFVAHVANTFWLVAPTFHREQFHLSWLDLCAFTGIGGIWLGVYFLLLARVPLLQRNDPQFEHLISGVEA